MGEKGRCNGRKAREGGVVGKGGVVVDSIVGCSSLRIERHVANALTG
jgi:hypothetical protein